MNTRWICASAHCDSMILTWYGIFTDRNSICPLRSCISTNRNRMLVGRTCILTYRNRFTTSRWICYIVCCNIHRIVSTKICYSHRCLWCSQWTNHSTRKCGQFHDLFRFGFTLSMPKFRNCCPRLCSMIPNNFKHFVHINLFLLLGWLRSCYSCNSAEKFNVRKATTTNFDNSSPYLSGQNSLF